MDRGGCCFEHGSQSAYASLSDRYLKGLGTLASGSIGVTLFTAIDVVELGLSLVSLPISMAT